MVDLKSLESDQTHPYTEAPPRPVPVGSPVWIMKSCQIEFSGDPQTNLQRMLWGSYFYKECYWIVTWSNCLPGLVSKCSMQQSIPTIQ